MKVTSIFYLLSFFSIPMVFSQSTGPRHHLRKQQEQDNFPNITGEWVQTFSNRYVQNTIEIDWDCVMVNIENINNTFSITKSASLHGQKNLTIRQTKLYSPSKDSQGRLLLKSKTPSSVVVPDLYLSYNGPFENAQSPEYLIFTGSNDLSLFVFAKNWENFQDNLKFIVLNLIQEIGYTNYYKTPMPSYADTCNSDRR